MFIVIDGLDGSGKGTQTKLVVAELEKQGKKVLLLDYPRYGENSAYFVEQYLNGKYGTDVSAKRASLFYALDRFDDLHAAQEKFSDYDYVISNRYVSASMIHQAGKIVNSDERIQFLDWLAELEYEICGIPKPDKVLFLDVPPEVSQRLVEKKEAREYIQDGSNKDIHEADDDHMNNAYSAALQVVKHFSDTWETVDCCKDGDILPIDVITKKILTSINQNMNKIVKDKMQREILVVPTAKLFENITRETKVYDTDSDFESVILESYEYMVRGDAEINFDYKQPIPYAIVLNENNEIFVYKRGGAGSNAGESRLHAKIAIGVGGHIEREDEGSENILKDSLIREVEEELNVSPDMIAEAFPIGYINQDTDEVCKVHLGIGYVVKLKTSNFELLDGELAHGEFKSFTALMKMIESGEYDVEPWTQMLAPEIKKYI